MAAMFDDLDDSLAALVRAELALPGVDISFLGPDDQFPPSSVRLPALSFFLYDIREQTDLRANDWTVAENGGEFGRTRAPARVACSYLITAWPSEATPDPAQDEHRLLGEVLRVLLRHHHIPPKYLRGSLVDAEPPLPTRIIAENRLQSLGEFWQAMGGRPKAALHYGVTLSADVFDPQPLGRRVDRRTITVTQGVAAG
jgi:hypothetical protein